MYRVVVVDDFVNMRLRLFLVQALGDVGVRVYGSNPSEVKTFAPGEAVQYDDLTPWAVLPREAAPAVLAALSQYLGAVEHPEQLRRDYEHERSRVDRLIDSITSIADRSTGL